LVVVGFLQWGIYRRQTGLIDKQREISSQQKGLMGEALEATKKAANAAELSAKASIGVSIATLLLSRLAFGETGAASLDAILQSPNIDVSLKNYGKTFAVAKFQTRSLEAATLSCAAKLSPHCPFLVPLAPAAPASFSHANAP
jgi:hypothetical protein